MLYEWSHTVTLWLWDRFFSLSTILWRVTQIVPCLGSPPCLLLSNILCNGRMTVVENPLLGDICAGASFGGLHIKVLWTLVSRGLWGWEFSFLWTNAWECHSGWSGSCTYHFGKETAQFSAEWLSASLCAHPPCACTHTLTARVDVCHLRGAAHLTGFHLHFSVADDIELYPGTGMSSWQ